MEPSTPSAWLSAGGLALGMAGVTLILVWGPPRFSDFGREAPTGRRPRASMSLVGLALVVAGFVLHLVAGWLRGT